MGLFVEMLERKIMIIKLIGLEPEMEGEIMELEIISGINGSKGEVIPPSYKLF